MGVVRLAALAVVLGLAVAPYPQSPADSSCAAPTIAVRDSKRVPVLHRGETVTVEGRGFSTGCDDTGGGDVFGCSGSDDSESRPMTDLELVFVARRGAGQTPLAVADAGTAEDGKLGQVTWTFEVPDDLPLGRGELAVELADRLEVTIRN